MPTERHGVLGVWDRNRGHWQRGGLSAVVGVR